LFPWSKRLNNKLVKELEATKRELLDLKARHKEAIERKADRSQAKIEANQFNRAISKKVEGDTRSACLISAMNQLGNLNNLSKDDLNEYASQVADIIKKTGERTGKIHKEFADEYEKKLHHEAVRLGNNVIKTNKLIKLLNLRKINIRDFLEISNKNPVENVPQYIHSAKNNLYNALLNRLSNEESEFLSSGRDGEIKIMRALDGDESVSDIARSIAVKINAYNEYRTHKMIESGALRTNEVLKNRLFRTDHNIKKILGGKLFGKLSKVDLNEAKNKWIEDVYRLADHKKTFGINPTSEETLKILEEAFDDITSQTLEPNVRRKKGDPLLKHRQIHFKDYTSEYEYQTLYGKDSLLDAIVADMNHSGTQIGISQLLGSDTSKTFEQLMAAQVKISPSKHGPAWRYSTTNMYNIATRTNQNIVSPKLAEILQSMRGVTSAVKLTGITIQSLSDWVHTAMYAQRWGFGGTETAFKGIKNLLAGINHDEKTNVAKSIKFLFDMHYSHTARFVENTNISSIDKLTNATFKWNGLERFDAGNKFAIMSTVAKSLGELSNKSMDALPNETRIQLSKYLNADEWDMLRANTKNGYFTMDNLEGLPDNPGLQRKVFAIFNTAAHNTVLSPGNFEKAFMYYGTRPGEPLGEVLRTVMQFKGFALSYIRRVLIDGYHDATEAQMRGRWAASLLAGTFALSYASNSLHSIITGKTPVSISDMGPLDLFKVLAGPLGVFLTVLSNQNQNQNLLPKLISTPTINLIGHALSAPLAALTGNEETAVRNFRDMANDVLPISSMPIIGTTIASTFGKKPYLEPGQELLWGD